MDTLFYYRIHTLPIRNVIIVQAPAYYNTEFTADVKSFTVQGPML